MEEEASTVALWTEAVLVKTAVIGVPSGAETAGSLIALSAGRAAARPVKRAAAKRGVKLTIVNK
ncbi:hypothetical protein P5F04_15850 [Clostridium perfringens]|nr:hypothetical protein [Clostridium perfringens]